MSVPKRNLLIILAHGLRSDALADEGVWPLATPHLAALAERGLRLTLTSACPADPGAMVSVISGRHVRQHGHLRDGQRVGALPISLPTWLAEAGYHTAGVGEVGAWASRLDEAVVTEGVGVAEPAPNRCWYTAAARSRGHGPALAQQRRQRLRTGPLAPDRLLLEPEEDIDGFIAARAGEAIARMPVDRPWALLVAFSGPGNDLPPPIPYDQRVIAADLGRDFVPADPRRIDAVADPQLPRSVLQRLEAHQVARVRADYLGRVGLLDDAVGRLQEQVQRRPDAARSWSVVIADRGQMLGESGLLGHRCLLDPALEVPLILSPPRGWSGGGSKLVTEDTEGLYSTIDVALTLAALAGADVPGVLAGRSLLPLLQDRPVLPAAAGCLAEFGEKLMLQTERYKVIFQAQRGRAVALFDRLADPDEQVNLMDRAGENTRKILVKLRLVLSQVLLPLRA